MFTKEEEKAIGYLRRAFDKIDKCPDLIVYVVDDCACVCKKGYSSEDLDAHVGRNLSPTNMLTDAHDDFEYGEGDTYKPRWSQDNPPPRSSDAEDY